MHHVLLTVGHTDPRENACDAEQPVLESLVLYKFRVTS
jgi:hypothetical protein